MQESTPSSWKRGASSAVWGSMPKSSMLETTCTHGQVNAVNC